MPYVLSAVAAHTNPASRAAAPSVCFRAFPSAAIGACAVLSPRELCSHPPRPTAAATCSARASAAAGDFFFFYLCAARASAVCGFFTTPNAIIWRATAFRSRRARMRAGFPVRVAVSIGESYRTYVHGHAPRTSRPHVEKGEQNVCADFIYTRIRSEVTVRAWAWVYVVTRKSRIYIQLCTLVCVCVCMAVWDGRLFGMHFGFKRLAVGGSGQVYSWC